MMSTITPVEAPLVRSVTFSPAFDKRPKQPGDPNCGIHGVDLRFTLKGEKGAVQFLLYTQWQLPEVAKELLDRPYEASRAGPHWMDRPMPADLGYHAYMPQYEGHTPMETCNLLPDAPNGCYYGGSGLDAEPVFDRLLREGDKGVWDALEEYYAKIFGELQ